MSPKIEQIDMTGADLAAALRLHTWLSIGMAEIVAACDACDFTRAFALISLIGANEGAGEDRRLVDAAADRLSPLLFGHTGEERRAVMKARLESAVAEILDGMDEEDADERRRPRGLPS
jgi:hypothetical protein